MLNGARAGGGPYPAVAERNASPRSPIAMARHIPHLAQQARLMRAAAGGTLEAGASLAAAAARNLSGRAAMTDSIAKQMGPRGWTEQQTAEAMKSGQQVRAINKATGNPAMRYVHPLTGQ